MFRRDTKSAPISTSSSWNGFTAYAGISASASIQIGSRETVVDGIPIVNTYVPQGYKIGTDKYVFKLEWFHRVRRYFSERLDPMMPAIWLGDLNVAPEPIDVYHPDHRVNDPDFHVDARDAYRYAVAWGFIDVFRKLALSENLTKRPLLRNFLHPLNCEEIGRAHV